MLQTYESLDVWDRLQHSDSLPESQLERARACLEADQSLQGCIYYQDLPVMRRKGDVARVQVPPVDIMTGIYLSHPTSQAWVEVMSSGGMVRIDIGASGGLLPRGVSCLRVPCVLCVRPIKVIPTATMRAACCHSNCV